MYNSHLDENKQLLVLDLFVNVINVIFPPRSSMNLKTISNLNMAMIKLIYVISVVIIPLHPLIINYILILISKIPLFSILNFFFLFFRTNHPSFKLNISSNEQQNESEGEIEDEDSINIYSKEQNPILYENDEPISDDEQVENPLHIVKPSSVNRGGGGRRYVPWLY